MSANLKSLNTERSRSPVCNGDGKNRGYWNDSGAAAETLENLEMKYITSIIDARLSSEELKSILTKNGVQKILTLNDECLVMKSEIGNHGNEDSKSNSKNTNNGNIL